MDNLLEELPTSTALCKQPTHRGRKQKEELEEDVAKLIIGI